MSQAGRRRFLLFTTALLASRLVQAQQQKQWLIGFLSARRDASAESNFVKPFLRRMRELGYVEGKNVRYEWRFADGKYDRLPSLAAELVRLKVDLILASPTPPARAAQQATKTIPIVMWSVANPIETGLVASLAHPGGNVTGLTNYYGETVEKQLEMLVATVPKLSRVAVLMNPGSESTEPMYKSVQSASRRLGIRLLPVEARTPEEIERAFATIDREHAQALLVIPDSFLGQHNVLTVRLAVKSRIPAMYPGGGYAEAGGLMSYAASGVDNVLRAADYVDKILRGAKPAELPVEQPTKFVLIVNLKTAKTLEIKIPQSILARADLIIE